MRITTYNVNSVRLRGDIIGRVCQEISPDILCLQEIKVETNKFPHELFDGNAFPYRYIHGQKAYHGVAILSKVELNFPRHRFAIGSEEHRHAIVELPCGVELHNLYIPAGGDIPDPAKNPKFASKLAMLDELAAWFAEHRRPQILVGDFNIAPLENDVWSHKQLIKVVSHTPIEVKKLHAWQAARDYVDGVRAFVPADQKLFTWWSYRARDWDASDRGRRLDHIWVTPDLRARLRAASVHRAARGWHQPSDHVPVTIEIDL